MNASETDDFVREVERCFESGGAFSRVTDHFAVREGQKQFAKTVAMAINRQSTEVVEAGTGTGKTFAYLTPALLAGCKVIVSTAGKPLQDQLYKKDLPLVQEALGIHVDAALLKGRANYICLHRLANTEREGVLPSPQSVKSLRIIKIFAHEDVTGDKTAIRGVPEDDPIWPYVTSTPDNCVGMKKCEYAGDCFVAKAREAAKAADVVIVNHHLFLSAMALKDEDPDAVMLPDAGLVIFDEAHKVPEIASNFFGSELSTYALKENAREIRRRTLSKHKTAAPRGTDWDKITQAVIHILMDLGLFLGEIGLQEGDSKMLKAIPKITGAADYFVDLSGALSRMKDAIEPLIENDEDLGACFQVCEGQIAQVNQWAEALKDVQIAPVTESGIPVVRWVSRSQTEARFNETPISVADDLAKLRQSQSAAAWVFTSATLATGKEDFSHFLKDVGLLDVAQTHTWGSPFDYANQAILYVPNEMPDPAKTEKEDYIDCLIRECWPVIDSVGGRTFVLCTSYKGMERAAADLRRYVSENNRDYAVYMQNEDTRSHLLEQFRLHGHAILVGSMSFWEGIDIKGELLSVVIIDKLPFSPVGDPVQDARSEWIRQNKGNPFMDNLVPMAAIALKQGTGRLIRSEKDRGILVIGDTRVLPYSAGGTRYGSYFLDSLPPYTKTRKLERVLQFWKDPASWT